MPSRNRGSSRSQSERSKKVDEVVAGDALDPTELLVELFGYYEIDRRAPSAWESLAVRLAIAHADQYELPRNPFEGLRRKPTKPKKGAPNRWDLGDDMTLNAEVARRRDRGESVRDACKALARDRRFQRKGRGKGGPSPETLRRRYTKLRKNPLIQKLIEDGLIR